MASKAHAVNEALALNELISTKLRPLFMKGEVPEKEKEVQDHLERMLISANVIYERERPTVSYGSKSFTPDFSFVELDLALEVKLIKDQNKIATLVDQMNADIPAYQSEFSNILFVIYDLGVIPNEQLFKKPFENLKNVQVLIVKH